MRFIPECAAGFSWISIVSGAFTRVVRIAPENPRLNPETTPGACAPSERVVLHPRPSHTAAHAQPFSAHAPRWPHFSHVGSPGEREAVRSSPKEMDAAFEAARERRWVVESASKLASTFASKSASSAPRDASTTGRAPDLGKMFRIQSTAERALPRAATDGTSSERWSASPRRARVDVAFDLVELARGVGEGVDGTLRDVGEGILRVLHLGDVAREAGVLVGVFALTELEVDVVVDPRLGPGADRVGEALVQATRVPRVVVLVPVAVVAEGEVVVDVAVLGRAHACQGRDHEERDDAADQDELLLTDAPQRGVVTQRFRLAPHGGERSTRDSGSRAGNRERGARLGWRGDAPGVGTTRMTRAWGRGLRCVGRKRARRSTEWPPLDAQTMFRSCPKMSSSCSRAR